MITITMIIRIIITMMKVMIIDCGGISIDDINNNIGNVRIINILTISISIITSTTIKTMIIMTTKYIITIILN